MREETESHLDIEDLSADTVKGMLQYMYTDQLPTTEQESRCLLCAADTTLSHTHTHTHTRIHIHMHTYTHAHTRTQHVHVHVLRIVFTIQYTQKGQPTLVQAHNNNPPLPIVE